MRGWHQGTGLLTPLLCLAQEATLPHAWFPNVATSEALRHLGPEQREEALFLGVCSLSYLGLLEHDE